VRFGATIDGDKRGRAESGEERVESLESLHHLTPFVGGGVCGGGGIDSGNHTQKIKTIKLLRISREGV